MSIGWVHFFFINQKLRKMASSSAPKSFGNKTGGVDKPVPSFARTIQPFVCGGASAMFASFCVQPIDLVKVRLQVLGGQGGAKASTFKVFGDVVKQEGFGGLYSGLSASLMRQAIYGTARLGLHRTFSNKLKERNEGRSIPFYQTFGSSFLSGAMASVIGNPFDVALVRMQADGLRPAAERRNYRNVVDALVRVVREEGAAQLWAGFPPTLLRAVAMNVGMMASYDLAKETYTKINGTGMTTNLMASATAGLSCAALSLPFDLMKTRLQNMKPLPSGEMPYTGVADCAKKILRTEGVLAFWTGFGAYYGRCAPHAMLILLTIEALNKKYKTFILGDDLV